MYQELVDKKKKLAVIGLGYVGLPIALEFARKIKVIGFDINDQRVEMMRNKIDPSQELESSDFDGCDIEFTSDLDVLRQANFFIVAVPTPVDEHNVPDLRPVQRASETIGKVIKKGDYVVYESTVYPGCTEEDCVPIIEKLSGLKMAGDYKIGYSPERINPGDKEHTITTITKVVSGCDAESLDVIARVYELVVKAGVHRASSIKVAEAAKIIENTQRDLNIALMNELSIIFDQMDIDTHDVIAAAGTKWNFIKLYPGLVGGHCIGVDPYYLLHKAKALGIEPQVIASGRRINDGMPAYSAKKLVQKLIANGDNPSEAKVLVMGVTFKEDVSDIRNSKVADLIKELMDYSIEVDIVDPNVDGREFRHEYGLNLTPKAQPPYHAVIVAVSHAQHKTYNQDYFKSLLNNEHPILFDLKGMYSGWKDNFEYWRL